MTGQPVPCPRNCACEECAKPILLGQLALPDGLGAHREQLWAHPACWRRRFAGI